MLPRQAIPSLVLVQRYCAQAGESWIWAAHLRAPRNMHASHSSTLCWPYEAPGYAMHALGVMSASWTGPARPGPRTAQHGCHDLATTLLCWLMLTPLSAVCRRSVTTRCTSWG